MAKRRMGIIAVLLCVCIFLMPLHAQAAVIPNAAGPISPQKDCSLTISLVRDGTGFSGVPVKLYHIADVSTKATYTLTPTFWASGLLVNGIHSNGEWDVIRSTLEAYILANTITPDTSAVTDQAGQVRVDSLVPGLYLVTAEDTVQNDLQCFFESALVALPGLNADGHWQYQLTVTPKSGVLPPIEPDSPGADKEIQFKILKLWKGDSGQVDRPQSIEAEIFRDGISYQTVTLSEENYWSYSWTAKEDGADWMVVERNVPSGYSVTVEERDTTFILTNTRMEEAPPGDEPSEEPPVEGEPSEDTPSGERVPSGGSPMADVPKTGDTTNILLYMVLMYVSGSALILLGITGKRKRA